MRERWARAVSGRITCALRWTTARPCCRRLGFAGRTPCRKTGSRTHWMWRDDSPHGRSAVRRAAPTCPVRSGVRGSAVCHRGRGAARIVVSRDAVRAGVLGGACCGCFVVWRRHAALRRHGDHVRVRAMKRIAVYPGSFDPITKGHEDLIHRSLEFVDQLIVAVAVNVAKPPLFSLEERVALIRQAIRDKRVEGQCVEGLLPESAKQLGAAGL